MKIFPAIDIRNGKCVRLLQGNFEKETIFSDSPIEVAQKWRDKGSKYLHVVDLDGAKNGKPQNLKLISEIAKIMDMEIQVGGGFRDLKTIETAFENGIGKVILGTSAIKDFSLLKDAALRYPNKIIVGIDARDGNVATDGWLETSNIKALELGRRIADLGIDTVIYTDIGCDGMLSGPNFQELQNMVLGLGLNIIASGGVSKKEDLRNLKELNLYGTIIGKALYTGDILLEEALGEV